MTHRVPAPQVNASEGWEVYQAEASATFHAVFQYITKQMRRVLHVK